MNNFKKGADGNAITYPMTQEQIDNLTKCRLVNPKVGEAHGIKPFDYEKLDEYLNEVIEARLLVSKGLFPYDLFVKHYPFEGECPNELPEPLVRYGLSVGDPKGLALSVHMDNPIDAPKACLDWLLSIGAKPAVQTPYANFLGKVPDNTENIADGAKKGLHDCFEVKWFYGVPRPEEVFDEKTGIHGALLTAYAEGCPCHPSYPAGHGAAVAGGVRRLIDSFDLAKDQIKVLLDTCYFWAMFRTLAGVHYSMDNVAGLAVAGLGKYFTKAAKKMYLDS
jgi:hypothetical protein